jgi:predicted GIY-YIG superfamily endonuclease
MASITPHKSKWRAQVYVGGIRDSKVFSTESSAREWACALENKLKKRAELKALLDVGAGLANFPTRIVQGMLDAPLEREQILAASIPKSIVCGIYFLIRGERIVYVGQSKNVLRRIGRHVDNGKIFDSFSFCPCAESDLDRLEAAYIAALYPENNYSLGRRAA